MFPLRNLGAPMGASVVLRWQVSDLECELQTSGTVWTVTVRQHGQAVRSAAAESASAAYKWANELAIRERPQRRTG
jgi:hypothetical protein